MAKIRFGFNGDKIYKNGDNERGKWMGKMNGYEQLQSIDLSLYKNSVLFMLQLFFKIVVVKYVSIKLR